MSITFEDIKHLPELTEKQTEPGSLIPIVECAMIEAKHPYDASGEYFVAGRKRGTSRYWLVCSSSQAKKGFINPHIQDIKQIKSYRPLPS